MNENAPQRYRILPAEFETSSFSRHDFPQETVAEAAFIGRSNVGKSTLLNAICGQRALARVGKTPGRTQAVNFFKLALRRLSEDAEPEDLPVRFVDLPGYGYAQVSKKTQAKWSELIGSYVFEREALRVLVLLIDIRRDPKEEERWVVDHAGDRELLIALTKCDKVKKNELRSRAQSIASELGVSPQQILRVSAGAKGKAGVPELSKVLCEALAA